jgi:hypothetical protein
MKIRTAVVVLAILALLVVGISAPSAEAGPATWQAATTTVVSEGFGRQVIAQVTCPANSAPTGGGYITSHHDVKVWNNFPLNNGWEVLAFVVAPAGQTITVQAWVHCS